MSLRFPSATSASSVPDGDKILRLYPWSGRTCAPPMNSLYVRSIGGSPGERGARSAERGTGRARLFRVPTSAFGVSAFKYSHIPSSPPSRPNPDSRYPPNPEAASNRLVQFTHTTPALILGATSSARLMFSVHTLAASPYGVLLASSTASAGVRKVIDTSTGPKISTWAMVAAGAPFVHSATGQKYTPAAHAPTSRPTVAPPP